jgi:hypothetical protein
MDPAKNGWTRRDPSVGPGDLWSGAGGAYQDWMRPPPPPAQCPPPAELGRTDIGRTAVRRPRRPRILLVCIAMLPPVTVLAAPLAGRSPTGPAKPSRRP